MLKKIILLSIFIFSTSICLAQLDNNVRAKLYYTEAEKTYNQGDFNAALEYVNKAEGILGTPVARTLALKIKANFSLNNFVVSKKLLDLYTNQYMSSASKELNDEILAMLISIEEAFEKEQEVLNKLAKLNSQQLIEYLNKQEASFEMLNDFLFRKYDSSHDNGATTSPYRDYYRFNSDGTLSIAFDNFGNTFYYQIFYSNILLKGDIQGKIRRSGNVISIKGYFKLTGNSSERTYNQYGGDDNRPNNRNTINQNFNVDLKLTFISEKSCSIYMFALQQLIKRN